MGYFTNASQILIVFVFGAGIGLFILRLLAEAARVDFYNPICQFLYRATHPLLAPLRRFVPSVRRINLAPLLLAYLIALLKWALLLGLGGMRPGLHGVPALLLLGLAELTDYVLMLYMAVIFAWSLMSFLAVDSPHPLVPFMGKLVGPVLRPLQRVLPTPGGIDFSPALAILLILLARALVVQPLFDFGATLAR